MPVHHLPQPLKTPLLCWHESLSSARNDALVALSADSARIATTRPLPTGTAVYLELEGGAGIDAVATALDATGFIVEFVTVDDAAAVLIERALRDNADDRVPQPFERTVSRPAAILSPPTAPTDFSAHNDVVEPEPALAHTAEAPIEPVASEAPSFVGAAMFGVAAVAVFDEAPVVVQAQVAPPAPFTPDAAVEPEPEPEPAAPAPMRAPALVEPPPTASEPTHLVAAPSFAAALVEPAPLSAALVEAPAPAPAFAIEEPALVAPPPLAFSAAPAVEAMPAVSAMQQDEVSIADALRFELDDDDDAVAAPPPAPVVELRPFSEPATATPAPAPIVEPFDDLHSDDLVDAAFAHYQPAPTAEQPDFDQAFSVPRAEQAAFDAAAEAAFLANDDVATEVPRTRTDELFALPADSVPAPATLSRTPTASLFDMPHTVTMGSLPVPPPNATQDLLLSPAALSAEAWAQAMGQAPATAAPVVDAGVPPAKETTDKWPLARAITAEAPEFGRAPARSGVDVVLEAAPAPQQSIASHLDTVFGQTAQVLAPADSFAAPEVTAPGAHAFALPITTNGLVLDVAETAPVADVIEVAEAPDANDANDANATWAPIARQTVDDDDDDTHVDPVLASDDVSEATVPAVAATPVNDVASDDLAEGFDVAFTNPGVFALEPMPTAESTFAPPPSTGEHAIDLELDDDEIELDHRPNLVLEPVDDAQFDHSFDNDDSDDHDHVEALAATAVPVAAMPPERVPSRPLPTLDPEPEPASDDAPRVVDVDFSEFRDVLGATRRVYDALLPSLLPRAPTGVVPAPPAVSVPQPPPTTAATLGLPQPPPSLLTPPEPRQATETPFVLPRPPGSRNTATLGFGAAGNPFGGDSERQRFADSVPPALPALPNDEPWTVSSPPQPAFPAPRLLDADLGPVLTAGNSSAPRGLPFVGDSGAPAPTTQTTVSPLTSSTPDDLPLVVGDQVVLSAEDLVDDDWQIGPGPGPGSGRR